MLKNISLKTRWAIGVVSALVLLVVCAGIVYAANWGGGGGGGGGGGPAHPSGAGPATR